MILSATIFRSAARAVTRSLRRQADDQVRLALRAPGASDEVVIGASAYWNYHVTDDEILAETSEPPSFSEPIDSVRERVTSISLHYAFDFWVQRWRKKQARADVVVVRYADDFVVGFEHREEAERFLEQPLLVG